MLYPPTDPNRSGHLDVGDGHRIYWEEAGNPHGKPALFLHGGPGTGCSSNAHRMFNPALYRSIVFDQRNCGRSTPHASTAAIDLSTNTTENLLGDMERLRVALGVDRWLLFGGSWGATLALAYAQRHIERVSEIVLGSVATTTRWEIEWMTRGVGVYFPEAWDRFCRALPEDQRSGDLAAAYNRRLMSADPTVHLPAARAWCDWEHAIVARGSDDKAPPQFDSEPFQLAFARIVTHYWRHAAWLEKSALLNNANGLRTIPGVLVHGRLDLGCPLVIPYRLAEAWPGSELLVVNDGGHDARHPGLTQATVGALDRFATR